MSNTKYARFNVEGQRITYDKENSYQDFTANTLGFYDCVFAFNNEWDEIDTRYAMFVSRYREPIKQVLTLNEEDSTWTCDFPDALVDTPSVVVGVIGYIGTDTTKRWVTNKCDSVIFADSTSIIGADTTQEQISIVEQLIKDLDSDLQTHSSATLAEYKSSIVALQNTTSKLESTKVDKTHADFVNDRTDTTPIADFYMFAKQGQASPIPSAVSVHNYTDSITAQFDNVGESAIGILVLKNARNPINRSDKENDYIGNSDFLYCCEVYKKEDGSFGERPVTVIDKDGNILKRYEAITLSGATENLNDCVVKILDVLGTREILNVSVDGETNSAFSVFPHYITVDGGIQLYKNDIKFISGTGTIQANKTDDGYYGFQISCSNKHANAFRVINGGVEVVSVASSGGVDYLKINKSLKYENQSTAPSALYGNTYYSQDTGFFYAYDKYSNKYKQFNDIYMAQFPTTGSWNVGDRVYNTVPSSGGYIGWVCTVAGTPGTWKGFGLIA